MDDGGPRESVRGRLRMVERRLADADDGRAAVEGSDGNADGDGENNPKENEGDDANDNVANDEREGNAEAEGGDADAPIAPAGNTNATRSPTLSPPPSPTAAPTNATKPDLNNNDNSTMVPTKASTKVPIDERKAVDVDVEPEALTKLPKPSPTRGTSQPTAISPKVCRDWTTCYTCTQSNGLQSEHTYGFCEWNAITEDCEFTTKQMSSSTDICETETSGSSILTIVALGAVGFLLFKNRARIRAAFQGGSGGGMGGYDRVPNDNNGGGGEDEWDWEEGGVGGGEGGGGGGGAIEMGAFGTPAPADDGLDDYQLQQALAASLREPQPTDLRGSSASGSGSIVSSSSGPSGSRKAKGMSLSKPSKPRGGATKTPIKPLMKKPATSPTTMTSTRPAATSLCSAKPASTDDFFSQFGMDTGGGGRGGRGWGGEGGGGLGNNNNNVKNDSKIAENLGDKGWDDGDDLDDLLDLSD
ncbi:hypothetical protein TrLO_g14835 [Triparma laevis f. longispina]|uniref:Uncharacterized protein n=1 Tax=Triparma laevis f. longispina TaxID=1714387 RepID=A0A9W7KZK3_9STRA|nr:hypothetical protein TrLO_g14835 [Triparma laevis f. longispina]